MRSRRVDFIFLGSLFVVLLTVHLAAGSLAWTGDEPRYAFQGLGLYTNVALHPTRAVWTHFVFANGYSPKVLSYYGAVNRPFNTLAPSVVYGPLLALLGLEAARWLSYVLGCAGLAALYLLLKRSFPTREGQANWFAVAAISAIALSLPFLPYLQLLYPEMLLFLVVTLTLYALLSGYRVLTFALIVLLPFVHMRGLPLAIVFFAIAMLHTYRDRTRAVKLGIVAAYLACLGLFLLLQLALLGSLTGGAFSTYPPSLAILPVRLGMQIFDVRHGLIVYSPLMLVGCAGLIAGAVRRNMVCLYSAVLLFAYFATFVWATAGESWTARYWVAALPFLAVGLCYWLQNVPGRAWYLIALPLALVAEANAALFAIHPLWFLENRRTSVTYAHLYQSLPVHVNFGLFLPIDTDPWTMPAYTHTIPELLCFTAVVLLLLVLCAIPAARFQRAIGALALLAVLSPFAICKATNVDSSEYRVNVDRAGNTVTIELLNPKLRVTAVQFDGTLFAVWTKPGFPDDFAVRCTGWNGAVTQSDETARSLMTFPGCSGARSIQLSGVPADAVRGFYSDIGHVTLIKQTF